MTALSIHRIRKKIYRYREIRKCFKQMSFLLENGTYYFKDGRFRRIHTGEHTGLLRRIKVNGEAKNPEVYDHGLYHIHNKYTFVFDDFTYQYVLRRKEYDRKKANIMQYADRLPYKTIQVSFDDERSLFISKTDSSLIEPIDMNERDDPHFAECLDYLFESLAHAQLSIRQVDMNGCLRDVFYCVQHGDCHGSNFIWKENGPVMIDLDAIELYPLFFDIVYYVHSYLRGNTLELFRSDGFQKKVQEILDRFGLDRTQNPFDLYLAAYIYRKIKYVNSRTKYEYLDFSLHGFIHADLEGLPLTEDAVQAYYLCVQKYGIRADNRA